MHKGWYLAVACFLGTSPLLFAQTGSARYVRVDDRELLRYEWQLQQDRNRLAFDRSHHASRGRIEADRVQVRRDEAAIRRLRAEMRRDQRARRHYHTM